MSILSVELRIVAESEPGSLVKCMWSSLSWISTTVGFSLSCLEHFFLRREPALLRALRMEFVLKFLRLEDDLDRELWRDLDLLDFLAFVILLIRPEAFGEK